MKPLFGGIEGGGTKFVCVVGTGPDDLRAEIRFPSTTPVETLGQAIENLPRRGTRVPAVGAGKEARSKSF